MRYPRFVLLLFALVFTACSVNKEPEFQAVKDIRLVERKATELVFELLLEFHNPNVLGGTFESDDLTFLLNDVPFSQMKSPVFEVPAQENFTMPVRISLNKNTFKGKQLELLSTILEVATSKQVKLSIKGPLQYKVLGYSSVYDLDYQKMVDMKL